MSWTRIYGSRRAKKKRLIQMALDRVGLNLPRVAERAGVSRQAVSATINGLIHSAKVLDALRAAGVDERLLFDPRKGGGEDGRG